MAEGSSTLPRAPEALDEELRALALIERVGEQEHLAGALARLGATPLPVRRLHPLLSIFVYLRTHTYVIAGGPETGVFSKFAVEQYPRTIPEPAWKTYETLRRQRLPVDEVAVFDDLAFDPYLAVRVGEQWYALHHWDLPAEPAAAGWRLAER